MATQNKVIKGKGNAVVILFGGPVDLTAFDKVQAIFGADDRNSADDPDDVVVVSATELHLFFGSTGETSSQYWEVNGFQAPGLPVELTSKCLGNLDFSPVC